MKINKISLRKLRLCFNKRKSTNKSLRMLSKNILTSSIIKMSKQKTKDKKDFESLKKHFKAR
jgi:hypothetical protein